MKNPKVGDKVLHKNGWRAQVTNIASIATNQGLAPEYNLKFLEGITTSIKCFRDDFFFPESEETAPGE